MAVDQHLVTATHSFIEEDTSGKSRSPWALSRHHTLMSKDNCAGRVRAATSPKSESSRGRETRRLCRSDGIAGDAAGKRAQAHGICRVSPRANQRRTPRMGWMGGICFLGRPRWGMQYEELMMVVLVQKLPAWVGPTELTAC